MLKDCTLLLAPLLLPLRRRRRRLAIFAICSRRHRVVDSAPVPCNRARVNGDPSQNLERLCVRLAARLGIRASKAAAPCNRARASQDARMPRRLSVAHSRSRN